MKNYFEKRRLIALVLTASLSLPLAGCKAEEVGSDKSGIDMIDTNLLQDGDNLSVGITQRNDVNGEDFKLIINYICGDGNEWRITDTKHLYMSVITDGLSKDTEVYIDNIHTDTSIVSTKAIYNGILQDTMDDRIHNSVMLGFPISDESGYFGCNVIEGQNSEFIQGWAYGTQYGNSGSIETSRRLESDFLSNGVYANQIDTVIDLIIVDKKTGETKIVSVYSSLLIRINNRITFIENGKEVTYEYDIYGAKTRVSDDNLILTREKNEK